MAAPQPGDGALARALNDALPQTQCTRCGYPDCQSYAQAIASSQAPINLCPPGGEDGVRRLAALTGAPALPLDESRGAESPRWCAEIVEQECIGCTLCLQACPVDCIVGAPKLMHTVVAAQCTGCELCLPACPVDCITLSVATPGQTGWQAWSPALATQARQRYTAHRARAQARALGEVQRLEAAAAPAAGPTLSLVVASAMARARAARSR